MGILHLGSSSAIARLKYVPENESGPKYPDRLRKMAEEHQAHLEVSPWSPKINDLEGQVMLNCTWYNIL